LEGRHRLVIERLACEKGTAMVKGAVFAPEWKPEGAEQGMKRRLLGAWARKAEQVSGRIEELRSQLETDQYKLEIAQRLLTKAQDGATREIWQTQVDEMTSRPTRPSASGPNARSNLHFVRQWSLRLRLI